METTSTLLYEEIDRQQACDNFLVQQGKDSRRTIIFFSSNGLVRDTPEDVRRAAANNAYEWMNISRDMDCTRIFVRDFKKSWYLSGINQQLNSVESLLQTLRDLSTGTSVTTVGTSAGGFAAVLFGCLLQADAVLTCSCQFTIEPIVAAANNDYYRYLYLHSLQQDSQYYSLAGLMRIYSAVPIFYLYPVESEIDTMQYDIARRADAVKTFHIKSSLHGYAPSAKSLQTLLRMEQHELLSLHAACGSSVMTPFAFEYSILGAAGVLSATASRVIRKIRKKLRV